MVSGSHGPVRLVQKHENDVVWFLGSESEKVSVQNEAELIIQSFWATLLSKFKIKKAVQMPADPQYDISPYPDRAPLQPPYSSLGWSQRRVWKARLASHRCLIIYRVS